MSVRAPRTTWEERESGGRRRKRQTEGFVIYLSLAISVSRGADHGCVRVSIPAKASARRQRLVYSPDARKPSCQSKSARLPRAPGESSAIIGSLPLFLTLNRGDVASVLPALCGGAVHFGSATSQHDGEAAGRIAKESS